MKQERPDACRVAAWAALMDAHCRLSSRLEAELLGASGISLSQYEVLLRLTEAHGKGVRITDLTQHARMTKSGVSRLIDRMERAELVRTESCPSDRRGAFAVLTARGRSVFRRAAAVHLRGIQEHFGAALSDDESAALRLMLERIRDRLSAGECSADAAADLETAEASSP